MTPDFPDPTLADDDLVAVSAVTRSGRPVTVRTGLVWPTLTRYGSTWDPDVLMTAYRRGLFPMPQEIDGESAIGWWSPAMRAVFRLDEVRVPASLRASMRRFEFTADAAFRDVVVGCADPGRAHGWIDGDVTAAYCRLHDLGHAHSVEVWRDGELVGGLYGVAVGGVFAGESMFHRVTDASKAALVVLRDLLADGVPRVIDAQWMTAHLASLGAREVPRAEYLGILARLRDEPAPCDFGPRCRTLPAERGPYGSVASSGEAAQTTGFDQ